MRSWRAAVLCALFIAAAPASAAAQPYAPLDQPGPPLDVPLAKLQASLVCEPSVRDARVTPVLLNPATGATAAQEYSWSWEPALDKLGIPWCAYTAPHHTLDDIQTSGEYIVYAIRTMHALAHRRIDILGHSQGGMSMRWALRFWPDTRSMVDDVVGIAATNHGTTVGGPSICIPGCPPADWQQFAASNFVHALNSRTETFAGISYTEIYTHRDEVVRPNSSPSNCTSCLHTGAGQITNVAVQDICPNDPWEHLTVGPVDIAAYALALDALTHPGPADPARIPRSVCARLYMPGINLLNLNTELQELAVQPGVLSVAIVPLAPLVTGAKLVKQEPALACYAFAACSGAAAPALRLSYARTGKRRFTFTATTQEGEQLIPVPGVAVTFAGRRRTTDIRGKTTFRLRLRRGRAYRVTATRRGCDPAVLVIRPAA